MSIVRRVAFGTAQLALANVFVRLLSVFTMPVLTRLLEPGAYGTAAMAATMISLMSVFALAGADVSYIRAYHSNGPASGKRAEALIWRFAIGGSLAASIVTAAGWHFFASAVPLPAYAGWLAAAGTVLSVLSTMAMARARLRDRHKALSIATVFAGIFSIGVAVGLAYCGWSNELPLILSLLVSYLAPVLVLGVPPLSELWKRSGLSFAERRHVLSIGFATIVTAPAWWLISSSDRWVLGYFHGVATTGIYSVGYNVAVVGMTLNTAVLAVWTPEAARLFDSSSAYKIHQLGSITEGMLAAFACTWLAVTVSGGDIVRLLAAPAFHEGAQVIPLIAASVFFHGVAHLANTIYLLENRVHSTIWWWLGGAAASLVLNMLLVPPMGMLGAALSQFLALAIAGLGLSVHPWRVLAADINWMRLLFVALVTVAPALFMVAPWADKPFASLLLKFPVGLLVALIVAGSFGAAPVKALLSKASIG